MARVLQVALAVFVYAIVYLALRLLPDQKFAGYFNTAVQCVGDAACTTVAFRAYMTTDTIWRGFFLSISAASAFLLVANLAWGIIINVLGIDPTETLQSLTYRLPYLISLGLWAVAWLEVVVRNVNRSAGFSLFVIAILVGGFLAALLVGYYQPLLTSISNPHRVFVFLYVGLEIAGLLCAVSAAVSQVHPYPLVIATGYAMLVACDFVFNTNELRGDVPQNSFVEIPWTIAQILVALGVGIHLRALEKVDGAANYTDSDTAAHVAIPLLAVTLVSGLSGALIARYVHPATVTLAVYLFAAAVTAIGISVLVRAYTRSLADALTSLRYIGDRNPVPAASSWNELLRLFGTAGMLDKMRGQLLALRSNTLPYGVDRLFPIEDAWSPETPRQVFIAMPYTQHWSDDVEKWIRAVVADLGWRAVRADELFDTRDVVDGLWRAICRSEIIVADLTTRNPNVLYEIGIAHCLAKPVILTCQGPEDIPFDLANKRIVLYAANQVDVATPRLRRALIGAADAQTVGERRQL